MTTQLALCNMALSHLGVGTQIAVFATDRSREASACRQFYDQVRDEILRKFPWSFATVVDALDLVEEDPNDEWGYSYEYPTDAVRFKRILNAASRIETQESRIPYRIVANPLYNGTTVLHKQLILTDYPLVNGEWTINPGEAVFPPDFAQAFSMLLASYIAPRVTGGDQFKLGERAFKMYWHKVREAAANNGNEQQTDVEIVSDLERARD